MQRFDGHALPLFLGSSVPLEMFEVFFSVFRALALVRPPSWPYARSARKGSVESGDPSLNCSATPRSQLSLGSREGLGARARDARRDGCGDAVDVGREVASNEADALGISGCSYDFCTACSRNRMIGWTFASYGHGCGTRGDARDAKDPGLACGMLVVLVATGLCWAHAC